MSLHQNEIFKGVDKKQLDLIEKESKILRYQIGQPLSVSNTIQNNILIIINGSARLLSYENKKKITIAKIGPGAIVGLGSLLRVEACEEVTASTSLEAISIPDKLIIKLYETDKIFHDNCNKNVYPGEIINLANKLLKNRPENNISIKLAFQILINNLKFATYENNQIIKFNQNFKQIIASSNFENKEIGELIDSDLLVKIRPPFSARIIKIPNKVYGDFTKTPSKKISNSEDKSKNKEIELATNNIEQSVVDIGQYSPKKNIALIKASGDLREALACIKMLALKLDLPYRNDSIERVFRDEIRRGKKINIDMCGGLLSVLGLHTTKARVNSKFALRIPENTMLIYKDGLSFVYSFNNNHLLLASPKYGWIEINKDNVNEHFPEEIDLVLIEKTNYTPSKKFGLEWFIPSLKKYKGVLVQVLIASFVVQLFGLANPLLIQVIIDKVISQRSLDTLQILGIAMIVVTIVGGIIGSLRTFLFTETTNRIDTRLGSEVIDHLLRLPLTYYEKRPVGELGSRVAELERIREFLTGQALTTILDSIFSVIYIVVMVIYSWLLTFVALGVVPIQILLTLIGSPLLRRQIRETAIENAKTQSHLVEILTGIQTVKAQNIETVSRWKWQELYGKYIARTFEKTITGTALGQTSQVLQQLSQLMVLWIGATLVLGGKLTLGQLIAFRIISGYVTQPLLRLSTIWQNIQELRVSFERLADIIDTPEESNESDKSNINLPDIKGNVSFENVSFSFGEGKPEVLKNINLSIPSGLFIGIAGQSGSGKSTLMKLLARLYESNQGKIVIDNYNIAKVELYSLRRQIGIVPQDPLLFAGRVSENIAITNPDVSGEEIIEVAKIADAHDFIMDLPLGYSTNVGERGTSLSGGQKQRLAIARTLLSKPKLLIMDEATSALDYETERRVCENLRKKLKGLTVFFITHRLSTIKNADSIVLMHDGCICEVGTHDKLIEQKGRYFALFRQQDSN